MRNELSLLILNNLHCYFSSNHLMTSQNHRPRSFFSSHCSYSSVDSKRLHLFHDPRLIGALPLAGLDIHFYRVKPQLPKDIPLLTTPRPDQDFVFEVVAPSLPGFGYSSQAAKPGLSALNMAHILKNLMLRLGHEKYYTQGGDWGAAVTAYMATVYPEQ
jgi:hypothetical protein